METENIFGHPIGLSPSSLQRCRTLSYYGMRLSTLLYVYYSVQDVVGWGWDRPRLHRLWRLWLRWYFLSSRLSVVLLVTVFWEAVRPVFLR